MPAFDLPYDLWFAIFEFVHAVSRSSASLYTRPITRLMLVCKAWKVRFERILSKTRR
jgi:hypothetical protein